MPRRADGRAPRPRRTLQRRTAARPEPRENVVLRMQATAGNAAVTAALQRQACAAPPATPVTMSPGKDPRFRAYTKELSGKAAKAREHPPAAGEVKAAQDAVSAPAGDKETQAKAAHTTTMSEAKPGTFDKAAFIAAVNAAIAAQSPQNLEEAENFAASGKADQITSQVTGTVTAGKEESAKDLTEKTDATPDTSKAVEKPVTPLPPGAPAPALGPPDPSAAVPKRAPEEQTELGAAQCETNSRMEEAGIDDGTFERSNEPEMLDALAAKRAGEEHTATAPAAVRATEADVLAGATADVGGAGTAGMAGIAGAVRGGAAAGAATKSSTMDKDSAERTRINGEITKIFEATKTDVKKILDDLDGKVTKRFDDGERAARAAFTADHKARVHRYEEERYGGWLGWAARVEDLITSPPGMNELFLQSRKVYEQRMQTVIEGVADLVGTELNRATTRIAKGRQDVTNYVNDRPPALRKLAGEEAGKLEKDFAKLDDQVKDKEQELADSVAAKYVEARNQVDEEIARLQEEHKGLWDHAKEAVGGAIDTVMKLKDMLLGVLARAANAIDKIIKDPIGFLGNLANAVRGGVEAFASNIFNHLKAGLKAWLFGQLASAGIEVPDSLDAKGIFKLILGLLGATWANIRARITRKIPEAVLTALEGTLDVVKMLLAEGPVGLLKWVVEQAGNLVDLVMGPIKEFVVEKIVKAGILWIVSLLNPAAAFVKACQAIYNIVMFFVERAGQIKEFVDSVLDSIESIASGGAGAVSGLIERTLARALPVVIGFLASLLGLGGITDKIRSVLETVQKPVNKVVDTVVDTIIKAGKKLLAGLRGKKGKKGEAPGEAATMGDVRARAEADLAAKLPKGPAKAAAVKSVVDGVYSTYERDGLKSIYLKRKGNKAGVFEVVTVASPGKSAGEVLADMGINVSDLSFKNSTFCIATVNREQITTQRAEGSGHAERLAIGVLRGEIPSRFPDKSKPLFIQLQISRSPCGPESEDCAGAIAQFKGDLERDGYSVRMMLQIASTYEGKTEKGGSVSPVGGSSMVQLQELAQESDITIEPWDILEQIKRHMGVSEISEKDIPADVQARLKLKADEFTENLENLGAVRAGRA